MFLTRKAPTNVDVVVLALAQLGGATKKTHSEDIAAKAFEIAPDRFGWRLPRYRNRNWPDKELVRAALVNAQTKEYGALVSGAYNTDLSKDGWSLTAAGSAWVMANEQRIGAGLATNQVKIPKQEAVRFCKRLKGDLLFKQFLDEGNLDAATQYQFTDLLECSPDAPKETIQTKFDRLLATAHVVRDQEVLAFLEGCRSRFSDLLSLPAGIDESLREAE
jgi:hypothetical protein